MARFWWRDGEAVKTHGEVVVATGDEAIKALTRLW